MANTIRIKRRAAGGAAGAPSTLKNAELAYNEQDNSLYYGFGESAGNAASIITIGGRGAFMDLTTNQTIAGTKTFSSTITGSISGNAGTATALATGRTISITGDLSYTSASFDGTGNVTGTGTLATVNSNVGTYTKVTVNGKGLVTAAAAAVLADLGTTTADFSMNSFKITSLAEPTAAQDAATKNYVDSVAQGLDVKGSVKAATTADITLSGAQTIDGVSVVAADRVLVKDQSTASQNGIYVVASGSWTRATDLDAWAEFPGAFTFVEQGSTNADTGWVCTADQGGTLGSTSVVWAQFSGGGSYIAGAGLSLTGNTFNVGGTTDRITVGTDTIDIASTYAGQNTITTVGTIGTGTWQGSVVAVAYGGTGLSTITSNGIVYGNGTSAMGVTAAGTWDGTNSVGQLLSVDSSGVPTWTNTIDGGTF